MRRVAAILLPLLALAACGGEPPPPAGEATAADAQVRAWFPPHGIVDTITLDAVTRLPLRRAALIAPDGHATPANYLNSDAAPSNATGQRAAQFWQDAVTGNNTFAALTQNAGAGAAPDAETQLLAIVSTADIPLPDPVAYRRDWRHYRIRLTFGTPPGEVEREEIPAPAPPAAAAPQP
ncbi:MAG TPA: hypothetical protein VMF86_13290 [Stellaceae bacterium]|nr:hypothetical protein [Stellaceae bacterium]